MPADGGEAEALTDFPGGVADFAWAPDGARLAVIASDPERPAGEEKPKQPRADRHRPLPVQGRRSRAASTRRASTSTCSTIAGSKATPLTLGRSTTNTCPPGRRTARAIAYVTKRGADPDRHLNCDIYLIEPRAGARGAAADALRRRRLDPYWESRPAWSPDGRRIAYLQSGEDKWIYYAPWQLAVDRRRDAARSTRPAADRSLASRSRASRRTAAAVLALIEQSRVTHAVAHRPGDRQGHAADRGAALRLRLRRRRRTAASRCSAATTCIRTRSTARRAAGEAARRSADHNDGCRTASSRRVEDDHASSSADGTHDRRLPGEAARTTQPGRRYPTILRIHGGPVYQFSHEFMADWQVYAAHGYAVVARQSARQLRPRLRLRPRDLRRLGQQGRADVLAAVDHVVALGVADPGAPRRRRPQLRRHPDQLRDRARRALQGRDQRRRLRRTCSACTAHDQYTASTSWSSGMPWQHRDSCTSASAIRSCTPTGSRRRRCSTARELDFNVPCIGAEQMYQALRSLTCRRSW